VRARGRAALVKNLRASQITLVLGAGVSLPHKVPNWEQLAKRVWEAAHKNAQAPWEALPGRSSQVLPQFLPIALELARDVLGAAGFTKAIRDAIYRDVQNPERDELETSNATLAVIARATVAQYRAVQRRLIRIVTLNADDLLERAIARLRKQGEIPVRPIARAAQSMENPRGGQRSIPVYHLHGFIPKRTWEGWDRRYEHMLVFTDAQYWASGMAMLSFANRVMGAALHDSRCLFIGLSMTDINILRWLALRYLETASDVEAITRRRKERRLEQVDAKRFEQIVRLRVGFNLRRHYWIRPATDDRSGLLTEFLRTRGVISSPIDRWGGSEFANLMGQCFRE
jgi:hypothetical protein